MRRSKVYIVGAGFSLHSGLPLQTAFTAALLKTTDADDPYRPLVELLRRFVHDVFDHKESARAEYWPELEDLFTNIDQAANTGHHLGKHHSPSSLRTARRVLLARIIAMLHERTEVSSSAEARLSNQLDRLFRSLDLKDSAFISMNWDTVIEQRLHKLRGIRRFDYGCRAIAATFPKTGKLVATRTASAGRPFPIVKMHGSTNWLYCDNCRRLYWFDTHHGHRIAKQLITPNEGQQMNVRWVGDCARWHCGNCETVPLTTRIATFSFLKALDFPMFERSWLAAEALLRDADEWIFIGYSLPAADYEFKHLLKRVQLSRALPPKFAVVTGGDAEAVDMTYQNYQRFFGRSIRRGGPGTNFYSKGLIASVIDQIV